jgi:hypothetical protein
VKQTEAAREAENLPRRRPDPPDYVPAERPDDQDDFDEAMKVGYRGIRELLERRRKKS